MNTQNSPLLLTHEDFPDSLSYIIEGFSDDEKRMIKEAYRISVAAHAGQQRKSDHSYISHIRDVLSSAGKQSITMNIPLTPDDIIVALLHDTLEDHPEYFDEIYEKFGYTILVRVLGLSKPSKDLYNKWKNIADRKNKETMPYQAELYQFWTTVIENWDSQNLEQKMINVGRAIYRKFTGVENIPSEIFNEIQRINKAYKDGLDDIKPLPETTSEQKQEKSKLFNKRWQEYTAELQIFLNPKENFKIKLADKTANLGDTTFHNGGEGVKEKNTIRKKSASILKSTKSYHWLIRYHKLEKLIPEFTQLETNFKASLAVNSPASGSPSQTDSH